MVEITRRGAWFALAMLATPAAAQDGPIGPCSPFRAADGDIPSEMPGCARRLRPAPDTLADELRFRRERGAGDGGDAADEDELPCRRARRPR